MAVFLLPGNIGGKDSVGRGARHHAYTIKLGTAAITHGICTAQRASADWTEFNTLLLLIAHLSRSIVFLLFSAREATRG